VLQKSYLEALVNLTLSVSFRISTGKSSAPGYFLVACYFSGEDEAEFFHFCSSSCHYSFLIHRSWQETSEVPFSLCRVGGRSWTEARVFCRIIREIAFDTPFFLKKSSDNCRVLCIPSGSRQSALGLCI